MTPDVETAKTLIRDAQAEIGSALDRLDAALVALGDDPGPTPPAGWYPHAITDRDPRPKPPVPELGIAGFTFTDPSFGTRLVRVTDAALGGSSWRVPSNAHVAGWNADGTRFVVVGPNGTKVFAFDPTLAHVRGVADLRATRRGTPRFEAVRDQRFAGTLTGTIDVTSQCEPCWSRSDPNVLYVVGGPMTRTIQAVTFDGDTIASTVDVLDLDTLGLDLGFDDATRTYVGGLLTSDDTIVVFFGGTGQDRHCYVGQLDEGATALSSLVDTRELGYLLHSVAVDRTGQYVSYYPTNAQPHQTVIADMVGHVFTPVTLYPGGHDALGFGWWVNADSGDQEWDAAQWQHRLLSSLDDRADLITPPLRPKEVYLSEHSTWNNDRPDASVPVISSTFRFNNEACEWRAWDDELIAIATAPGPSVVYRFCHHRSDSRDESNPAGTYFWYQPIANVSPDGRWCLFTSNWEKTLGDDPNDAGRSRQDVFLAELR